MIRMAFMSRQDLMRLAKPYKRERDEWRETYHHERTMRFRSETSSICITLDLRGEGWPAPDGPTTANTPATGAFTPAGYYRTYQ